MFSGRPALKLSLLSLLPLLIAFGCGPKKSSDPSNGFTPTPQINFEEDAQPTLTPPPQNDVEYQPAPDVVTNNGTQIFLNRTVLTSPRMHYSSQQKQLTLTGQLAILDENRNKLIEKSFSLSGTHTAQSADFNLHDQIPSPEGSDLRIKAVAHCLGTDSNDNILCDHVVVDVIAQHNGRYYSEQVEVNRNTDRTLPQLRPTPPPAPPPASGDQTDTDDEDPDQDQNGMQSEGEDDSIQGRYQGSVEVIDLSQLFADQEPAPSPELPPTAPPAAGTSEDSTATPPSDDSTTSTPDTPSGDSSTVRRNPPPPAAPPSQDITRRDEPRNEESPQPPAPTVEAGSCNRNVSPNIAQMRNGNVRPCNQAVGLPANGQLRDPVSMVTRSESLGRRAYFVVASPTLNKHFATYEMAEMIVRAGAMMNQRYEKRVYLSRVSARRGGRLPPSVSHQIGNDVDLGYPNNGDHMFPLVVTRNARTYHPRNYSVEKTYNLFKYLFSQQDIQVERIFVDQKIKDALCTYAKSRNEHTGRDRELVRRMFSNLQHVAGHGDHFHMRIRCSRLDPACRGHQYRRVSTCE